jgi:NADH-quinone oxidoreductase subunit E
MAADMDKTCAALCWGMAGLLALLLAIALGNAVPLILALLVAALIGLGAALLLQRLVCSGGRNAPAPFEETKAADPDTVAPTAPQTAADPAPAAAPDPGGDIEIGSTLLAQEQELAARKGTWRYEPEGKQAANARADTGDGDRPAILDRPRGGKADDLKRIKGIGPKLERLCNEMGFYHFDQIAGWTDREIAWVDANLVGFRGRVSRDDWVAQARTLAVGGETEFSSRVDKGDVY